MEITKHTEECTWNIRGTTKSKEWYQFMKITHCPKCGVEIEVTNE